MDPIPLSLPFLMDGATGTELQKRGMPLGACTEQWALEHPEALLELQRAYVEAGAQVLVTPTLGANRGALEKFGLADRVEEYNARLTGLTRQAAAGRALVAGDLGPTLHYIRCALSYQNQLLADIKSLLQQLAADGDETPRP